ncbi:MAG: MFS transporter [bacterium]
MNEKSSLSERQNKINFILGFTQSGLWGLALTFSSITTVIPAFLQKLGASNIEIGLIPSLVNLGFTFPSILSAPIVERTNSVKRFVITVTWLERLPYLFLAILSFSIGLSNPRLAIYTTLALIGMANFGTGFIMPGWMDFVARIIPITSRGKFIAIGNGLGGVLGIVGAEMVGRILNIYPFPKNFSLCFSITMIILIVAYLVLLFIKEPSHERSNRNNYRNYFPEIPKIIKKDRNFKNYVLARIILSFGGIGIAFYTVYAVSRFSLPDSVIGVFTMFLVGAQPLANILWGPLADRVGHKYVLLGGVTCNLLGNLLVLVTRSPTLLYLAFALSGATNSAFMISGLQIILEIAPSERRPTYIGINNVLISPFLAISPILGGYIADKYGYLLVFLFLSWLMYQGFLSFLETWKIRGKV